MYTKTDITDIVNRNKGNITSNAFILLIVIADFVSRNTDITTSITVIEYFVLKNKGIADILHKYTGITDILHEYTGIIDILQYTVYK